MTKKGKACKQTRTLSYVQMWDTICPTSAYRYVCSIIESYGNLVFLKPDGGIQNMMSGAGVYRTVWWDFRFSGQIEVLLEFLLIK